MQAKLGGSRSREAAITNQGRRILRTFDHHLVPSSPSVPRTASIMSANANVGAIRGGRSNLSAKDKHRLQELPEPRGLACTACRKKKHLCDRRKPSCTTCVTIRAECVYAGRKPNPKPHELLDVLQTLERKYTTRLNAIARKGTRRKVRNRRYLSGKQLQVSFSFT